MKRWLAMSLGLFAVGVLLALIGLLMSGEANRSAVRDGESPVGQILPQGGGQDGVPAAQPPDPMSENRGQTPRQNSDSNDSSSSGSSSSPPSGSPR